ncbi:MAG: hypothetical protein M3321_10125, partial [Actinomycetota bacterium]|nr:hypothetical protein [Actinomycetota bacterium]
MTPRARVTAIVASIAATAAVVTVGATILASSDTEEPAAASPAPRPGAPPVLLDLGVRDDPEARALRRAETLHRQGRRREAARIFERFDSVEADVGAAVAAWPDGTVERLEALVRRHPASAVVRLHLGYARFWR